MDEFFRTRMGVRFFNTTMPKIADELERLNANLEALATLTVHAHPHDFRGGAARILGPSGL